MFFVSKNNHAATSHTMMLVAIYEILKGLAALVFAGMVFFWHNNLLQAIKNFAQYLHHWLGQAFVTQIDNLIHYAEVADNNWQIAVMVIIGYALLRWVEAYGLIKDRGWAYWLSIVGYMIFVPVEIYDLMIKPFNWVHILVFVFNILIVVLVFQRMRQKGLFYRSPVS